LLDVFVLDRQDEALAAAVRALGLDVVVTDTVMTDAGSRARLALEMLAAAEAFRPETAGRPVDEGRGR
jgi:LPPG:FO 2-phospho-L-lactate transferase